MVVNTSAPTEMVSLLARAALASFVMFDDGLQRVELLLEVVFKLDNGK
jgi:hypothetical protein